MSQLELSRRTGIATSNISDWKKKKTNPKADCLLSICDALDITPEQLLTGKGIDPEYKDADMDYEVTRSDIKILKQIHSLEDEQYKRLMAYMKALQKLEQMSPLYILHDYRILLDHLLSADKISDTKQHIVATLGVQSFNDQESIYNEEIKRLNTLFNYLGVLSK